MAKTDNLTDFLTDLADGIRAKKGITDLINPQNFRSEIDSISATPVVEPITITENGVYPVPKGGGFEFDKEYKFKDAITAEEFDTYIAGSNGGEDAGGMRAYVLCDAVELTVMPADATTNVYMLTVLTNGAENAISYVLGGSAFGLADGWQLADKTPTNAPTITVADHAKMSADLATTAIFFDVETKALDGWGDITVNVAGGGGGGGIIDVETLPTENIDENAVYRVTETVDQGPLVGMYNPDMGGFLTIDELMAMQGVPATCTSICVAELPATMEPSNPMGGIYHCYVLESDGIAYVSTSGSSDDAMGLGAMLGAASLDKGWAEDASSMTEQGIYCVRGESYNIYHYWHYRDSVWAEFMSVADVFELPVENIASDICYHVIDESSPDANKYFVFENEINDWMEWSKGPDTYEFISGEGTGHLKLPTGMTNIAPYACYGRNYDKVSLPATLTSIGEKAFQNCPNLRTFYVPSMIGMATIESPVTWADPYSVIVQTMGKSLAYGREGVQYEDGTNAGYYVVHDEQETVTASEIYIASSVDGMPVKGIDGLGFRYNNFIKRVEMMEGIEYIGSWTFADCGSLSSITIPASVTDIYMSAFNGSSKLVEINYGGTVAQWNSINLESNWDTNTGTYTIHCTDGDIAKS